LVASNAKGPSFGAALFVAGFDSNKKRPAETDGALMKIG